jgi:hypothetical protein
VFKKKFFVLIILVFSLFLFFSNFNPVFAVDTGLNTINNEIELGSGDPRELGARIINITIAFLGLIAVVLIIYAGFLWMTANGDDDKVSRAKRVLKNSVIGLVIILASWGIAVFVLNKLVGATSPGTNEPCVNGEENGSCGCNGILTCVNENWECVGSNCGPDDPDVSCDGNTLTPVCDQDNSICDTNYFCNNDCHCQKSGDVGDSCDSDTSDPECNSDSSMCSDYLECDAVTCLCIGSPIIFSISPFGGFCEDDINQPCEEDNDCDGTCNLTTPNGSEDSFISIHGQAFDEFSKIYFTGTSTQITVEASNPSSINSDCSDINTSKLIIVAVPAGAVAGPIKVVNGDGKEDATDDDFGPGMEDFIVNTIDRPGLCKLNPEIGKNLDSVVYYGNLLNSGKAFFGNYNDNILAYNNVFVADLEGSAQIPNVQSGEISTFVRKNSINNIELNSNIFDFTKLLEEKTGPYINSFSPNSGPSSQYVTIYGGGFGDIRGSSHVYFNNNEVNYDFPEVCVDAVWSDNKIIIKVPDFIDDGPYSIKITIDSWIIKTQSPNLFTVDQSEGLAPSLCRIQPQRGPLNSQVILYGEYFGDIGQQSTVIFSSNPPEKISENTNEVETDGDSQFIETIIPTNPEAISGPVKIKNNKDNKTGNSLNFIVGECALNSDCSPEVCCPNGSPSDGRCVATGPADNIYKNCFSKIPSSVFQWNFTTMWGVNDDYDSCLGMAQNMGACQDEEFCPNSPGQCSSYAGGEEKIVGYCKDDCSEILGCGIGGENCEYDESTDRCEYISGENIDCSLDVLFVKDSDDRIFNTLKTCNENNHWQIQTTESCPAGWTSMSGDICVDAEGSSCVLCGDELNCIDDNDNDDEGICLSNKLCSNDAYCNGSDECVYLDSASCNCCCRKYFQEYGVWNVC